MLLAHAPMLTVLSPSDKAILQTIPDILRGA
jgi:hypothetical protein